MIMKRGIIQSTSVIWHGEADTRAMIAYTLFAVSLFFTGAFIAMIVYPGGFSLITVYTSYLGSPVENPNGWIVYNTFILLSGIASMPVFTFLYKSLRPTMKALTFIASVAGLIGCTGLAALSFCYEDGNADAHRWATNQAFGGFWLSAILLLPPLIKKRVTTRKWPSWPLLVLIYGQLIVSSVCALVFDLPGLGKLWEWIAVFSVMAWLLGLPILCTGRDSNGKEVEARPSQASIKT